MSFLYGEESLFSDNIQNSRPKGSKLANCFPQTSSFVLYRSLMVKEICEMKSDLLLVFPCVSVCVCVCVCTIVRRFDKISLCTHI